MSFPIEPPNHSSPDHLQFGSLLVYRPGRIRAQDTDMTKLARHVTMALKQGDPKVTAGVANAIAGAGAVLKKQLPSGTFSYFLGADVALVPAPGHAPEPAGVKRQSPTRELVAALESHGLGTPTVLLQRQTKVQKAAWAPPGERPTTQDHYNSISVTTQQDALHLVKKITIVDDVVTSGATMHACFRLLRSQFPQARIMAFAAIRTLSDAPQITHILDPVCHGEIILSPLGWTQRVP